MNALKLTLDKATESSNGGYILKLVNSTETDTPFGPKTQSITYYMKVAELAINPKTNKPIAAGFEATLDIEEFDVVIRDFVPEEGDNAGQVIPCKWLQLKPAA